MTSKTKKLLMIAGGAVAVGGAYLWYRDRNSKLASAQLAAAQAMPAMPLPSDYIPAPPPDPAAATVDPDPVIIGTAASPPQTVVYPVAAPRSSFRIASLRAGFTGSVTPTAPVTGSGGGGGGGGRSGTGSPIRQF